MINVNLLSKNFGNVKAVDSISFRVEEGEIFGLLGANGAGKTTTLRMLATMLTPSSGSAEISGYNLLEQGEKIREITGLLFGGDTGLYDRLTALENIVYFAELNGVSPDLAAARAKELAEIFNFEEYINKPAGKLSKGTRQKVAFSRAVAHNPQIMLFDEPTSGLDVTARKDARNFILRCKNEGKTIILSDHNISEIEDICDRIGIMSKGKILDIGSSQELIERYSCSKLEDVFFTLDNREEMVGA